jgi:hypothetical protein
MIRGYWGNVLDVLGTRELAARVQSERWFWNRAKLPDWMNGAAIVMLNSGERGAAAFRAKAKPDVEPHGLRWQSVRHPYRQAIPRPVRSPSVAPERWRLQRVLILQGVLWLAISYIIRCSRMVLRTLPCPGPRPSRWAGRVGLEAGQDRPCPVPGGKTTIELVGSSLTHPRFCF